MKKNLTFIAMAAVAILCSCGSSENEEKTEKSDSKVVQAEAPKVKVAVVKSQDVPTIETYSTTVEAQVKNNIIPNSPLRIEEILVEVGDNVKKGQKLVMLDASSLDQLKMQIENQESNYKRLENLQKAGGISKQELENAMTQLEVNRKSLESRLENTVLVSPIDGVITARNYDNGDMFGGQPILVVEQISPVKMKINVSEALYAKTNRDLEVKLTFSPYGNEEFTGVVNIIYPTIDAKTHTFPVELVLENKDGKVRPGMYGKAEVNFGTASHVVVPDKAVKKVPNSSKYYVYTYADGKVKYNEVVLGQRLGENYELLSGIEPGSTIVTAGHTSLTDGAAVEVIE